MDLLPQCIRANLLQRLLAFVLFAVSATPAIQAQYRFDNYSTDEGIPQNSVHAILQTRDGYIWFTTFDGLVRYDGVHFTVFDKGSTPGIGSNRFSAVYEAPDGSLWFGTADGGLIRYEDGTFHTYTTADGLPNNEIQTICDDGEGGILVWTHGGVSLWRDGRFIPHPLLNQFVYQSSVVERDHSGDIWFVGKGQLHRLKNGQVSTYTGADGLAGGLVSSAYEDSQGRIWIGTALGKLYRFEHDRFIVPQTKGNLPPFAITTMRQDRSGNLWLSAFGAGLARLSGDQITTFTTADGLPSNRIASIFEDREGSLWLGTDNHGLVHVRREAVRVFSEPEGLSGSNVYPIAEDAEGGVWAGTWDGGLSRYFNGRFKSFHDEPSFPKGLITALHQDRAGRLWVGLYFGIGRIEGGKFVNVSAELGLQNQSVFVIHEDRTGALWIGARTGLFKYAAGNVTHYTSADGLAGNDVKDIIEDAHGNFWIATYGGLSRLNEGRFVSFTTRDGLASNSVRTLYEDHEGTLWIGTYDGGLSRLKDGKFVNYRTADGLFSNGVFRILEDDRGNFWMSCNRGIFRVSREQLQEFAAGTIRQLTCVPYGRQDGLTHPECNGGQQPAGIKARDGKLWFPTQGGVAVIDPNEVRANPYAPPVVIENAILDHSPVQPGPALRIRPGQENLEISYTGLSFINSDHVTFRYRMEGLDADWVGAGTRRVAYYAHLPPGEYTFKVIAANADGVWNTTGATFHIVVVPPFWRTWYFLTLVSLSVVGLAYLFYSQRLARVQKAHAAQRAFSQQLIELQEGERKRIAAGLHDSLGQNLLIIKNRALLGLQTPEGDGVARAQLEQISAVSSQALDEVREIAYDLHPYQMDRLGLTKAIQSMLRKVAAASDIEFTTDIDKLDGLFPKESEINIYRIIQESVNNLLKHSGAKSARVGVKRVDTVVEIVIDDDGKGFSPELAGAAWLAGPGLGMASISERARMLGGKHTIRSAPGRGTTVTIRLSSPGDGHGP